MINIANKFEYPRIDNGSNNILGTLVVGNETYKHFQQNDVIINDNVLLSDQLLTGLVNTEFFDNVTKYYYYKNYIPIDIDTTLKIFTKNELLLNTTMTKVLLQEITIDNDIYQHYIDISIVNYSYKITSSHSFHNIKTSFFYLFNIIPCTVTYNMNLILLNPEYNIVRPVNTVTRNKLDMKITIAISTIGAPIRTNKKWRYRITLTDDIYNKIKDYDIYIDNELVILVVINNIYYIIVNNITTITYINV
jgi:hypothetical protein